jgi:hypothetical protein
MLGWRRKSNLLVDRMGLDPGRRTLGAAARARSAAARPCGRPAERSPVWGWRLAPRAGGRGHGGLLWGRSESSWRTEGSGRRRSRRPTQGARDQQVGALRPALGGQPGGGGDPTHGDREARVPRRGWRPGRLGLSAAVAPLTTPVSPAGMGTAGSRWTVVEPGGIGPAACWWPAGWCGASSMVRY